LNLLRRKIELRCILEIFGKVEKGAIKTHEKAAINFRGVEGWPLRGKIRMTLKANVFNFLNLDTYWNRPRPLRLRLPS